MTKTANVLIVRHAAHEHLGKILSGRQPEIPLAPAGRDQARRLAQALQSHRPVAVQSSPVQRARETAEAIAQSCSLTVQTVEALDEVDFGEWTGRAFAQLEGDPEWTRWNECRSQAAAPGGESMVAAQRRTSSHLHAAAEQFAGASVVMVTHCDIIRALVASVLGLSLDHILRFDIEPASVSRIMVGDWGARVHSLNEGFA